MQYSNYSVSSPAMLPSFVPLLLAIDQQLIQDQAFLLSKIQPQPEDQGFSLQV